MAHVNINGLRYKSDHVERLLYELKIDLLGISETKLAPDVSDGEVHIRHFTIFRKDRDNCGGGVAIYARNGLAVNRCSGPEHPDIESVWLFLHHRGQCYQVGSVYRPPGRRVDYWSKLEQSWQSLQSQNIVILGDFNADPTNDADFGWKHLKSIAAAHALQNWIHQPTRITPMHQSCLDLLFSDMYVAPSSARVLETHVTDHCMIVADMRIVVCHNSAPKMIVSRNFSKFDIERFAQLLGQFQIDEFSSFSDLDVMWAEWQAKFFLHWTCVPHSRPKG